MQVVQTEHTEGKALFGGASNSYYATPESRRVVTQLVVNAHGEYVGSLGTGRVVNGELVVDYWVESSPVSTDEAEVKAWLSTVFAWAPDNYVGQFQSPLTDYPWDRKVGGDRHSVCPDCDHFDTLTVAQEAWGDRTTCTTEGCTYERFYSIGD